MINVFCISSHDIESKMNPQPEHYIYIPESRALNFDFDGPTRSDAELSGIEKLRKLLMRKRALEILVGASLH